jgi:putative peptidoglycan lipid II flippase
VTQTSGRAAVAGLAGSALVIAVITVVARITGFGRTLAFSHSVGTQGCLGTAYATANRLPNVLFEVAAGGALAGAVVPVLAARLAAQRRDEADQVASAVLTWTVALLAPLAVLLATLAVPLSDLLLGSNRNGCAWTPHTAAVMLVIFAPQVVLYGIGIVLAGVLQAHHRFAWPAVAPLLSSVTVIAAYLVFGVLAGGAQDQGDWQPGALDLAVLAGGTTLGVVALSLPLLLPVRRAGVRLRPTFRFPPGAGGQVRALALAGIGTLLAQQVAVVTTVVLAGRVGGTGAFTVFESAQAVYLLPYAVLAVPVATAAFPRLSAQASRADSAGFAHTLSTTTQVVVLVALGGTALLLAGAPAVQELFLGLDAVGGGLLPALGATLTALAPGLLGWSLVAHLGRALYAGGQGRAAAIATATGWLAAVGASLGLVLTLRASGRDGGWSAVVGLGAGNSAGMTVAGALLLLAIARIRGWAALSGVPRALMTGLVAAAAGAVPARLLIPHDAPDVSTVRGALVHGVMAALLCGVLFAVVAAALNPPLTRTLLTRVRGARAGGAR